MAMMAKLCFRWSRLPDLNRPPTVYDTVALPDELSRHKGNKIACLDSYYNPASGMWSHLLAFKCHWPTSTLFKLSQIFLAESV